MDRTLPGRVLLVDLENVHRIDLSSVPDDARVMIFYGVTQKKLPEAMVVQAQPLGPRLKWVRIAGQGPNALDFHIAFYLGQILENHPSAECVIVSGDTGFDPLMRHVQALGRICKRVAAVKDAFPIRKHAEADHFARLLLLLKKEKSRPAKRRGLAGKLKSWFPDLTEDARLALIHRLFEECTVRESEKVLTYVL